MNERDSARWMRLCSALALLFLLLSCAAVRSADGASARTWGPEARAAYVYDALSAFADGGKSRSPDARDSDIDDPSGAAAAFTYGGPSNSARASLRPGGSRLAPQTTLYRAVSTAEADDIARFGGFRAGPNSYEGKLFATSAEDAARYGRINDALTPGGSPFHIVETRVPTSLASSFERMTLDSMQAVHVAEGQLGALNAAGRWRTWDWVPWVGKPGSGL